MIDVPRIVSVVEGVGERAAVPILIERIGLGLDPPVYVDGHQTVITRRDTFPRYADIRERAVRAAIEDAGIRGAILVLLDSDGEPPCRHGSTSCLLGADLEQEIQRLAPNNPVAVVVAHWEYESWFLAAAASLSRAGLLRQGVDDHPDPESVPDAKGQLSEYMPGLARYVPTKNQARFTARFDLQAARRAGSFDRCYREIERLVRAVAGQA